MARGGVNKVILIGNVGADPELRYTAGGTAVSNFNIATNENWTDSSGERQERTEWHRIVVWGRLAEICNQYLRKGSKVFIEGRLQTRSWEAQDGQKRYTTEVVARDMQMLDSRGEFRFRGEYVAGSRQAERRNAGRGIRVPGERSRKGYGVRRVGPTALRRRRRSTVLIGDDFDVGNRSE